MSDLLERVANGDRRALARAISVIERGSTGAAELAAAAYACGGSAALTGFTGPPGAGKSTLVGRFAAAQRARERDVAVLSVDPSSPFTGGAVLGDRIRLVDHFLDDGVFIRSMAARGALGGLADAAVPAIRLLEAAGFPEVAVETVGVGQSEIDVMHHTDTVVLVLMPGAGDTVQAIKAGVLEVADVIAVNKADQPGAEALARDLRRAARLERHGPWRVPVVLTSAHSGAGCDELSAEVDRHREHLRSDGRLVALRRERLALEVVRIATRAYADRLTRALDDTPAGASLLDALAARRIDPRAAAEALSGRCAAA